MCALGWVFVLYLCVDGGVAVERKCVCFAGMSSVCCIFLCGGICACVRALLCPLVSSALLVFVANCGDQVRSHGCGKPIAPGDDTLERGNLQQPRVGRRVNKRLSWGPSKRGPSAL